MSLRPLPRWNYTKGIPAFYDSESATAVEQTHKVYNKINELVEEYNEFAEGINQQIEEFINTQNGDYEEFKVGLRQEFQEFIDIIDLKVSELEKMIDENGFDDLQTLTNEVNNLKSLINTSNNAIQNSINTLESEVNSLKSNVNNLEGEVDHLESEVNILESKVNSFENSDDKLTALESDVNTLKSNGSTLNSDVSTLKNKVGALESNATSNNQAIADISSTLEGIESEVDSKLTEAEEKLTEAEEKLTDVNVLKIKSNELEYRLANVEKGVLGIIYNEEVNEDEAYSKDVPDKALQYAYVNKVGSKSLVLNQMIDKNHLPITEIINGVAIINNNDGSFTLNGTATSSFQIGLTSKYNIKGFVNGRKYLFLGGSTNVSFICYNVLSNSGNMNEPTIRTCNATTDPTSYLLVNNGATFNNFKITPQIIDLTLMFGSGKEPDLETCKRMFAKYTPYNPGTLIDCSVKEVKSVGVNIWDEEWEVGYYDVTTGKPIVSNVNIRSKNFIRVLPSTTYFGKVGSGTNIWVLQYDINKEYLGSNHYVENTTFKTNSSTYYIKFYTMGYGIIYQNDICINVSNDQINRTYFPYKGDILTLPDIDLGAFDTLDLENKKVINRTGVVEDMSTLTWYYTEGVFYTRISDMINSGNYDKNILCSKYSKIKNSDEYYSQDKFITGTPAYYNNNIIIKDSSYTTEATFKASLQGVKLYYELATPIETDLVINNDLPFIEVEPGGTITFENDYKADVPNTITFNVEVK